MKTLSALVVLAGAGAPVQKCLLPDRKLENQNQSNMESAGQDYLCTDLCSGVFSCCRFPVHGCPVP